MKELGKLLKSTRKKQNLSLEDVAERTKIHIQKLRDIEDGNKDALPAKVFCIGLIKSYARELRLDMNQVDQLCQEAFKTEEVVPELETPDTPPKRHEQDINDSQTVGRFKIPRPAVIAASIVLSLLLLFIIVQIVEKVNSYSREEALPKEVFVTQEPEELNLELPSTESDSETKTETDPEAPTILSSESIQKPKEEQKKPPIEESSTPLEAKVTETIEPSVAEPLSKVEQVKSNMKPMDMSDGDFQEDNFGGPTPSLKTENSAEPTETVAVSDNKLTLTALEPVRAEVVWSDGYVQVMLLKSRESKTLVFSKPITVRVNNGGAVQISFNESEKKVPGTFNKPIELTFP